MAAIIVSVNFRIDRVVLTGVVSRHRHSSPATADVRTSVNGFAVPAVVTEGRSAMSTPHPKTIERIRAKLAAGQLSRKDPDKVWTGYGSLVPCDACETKILPAQVEYSFTINGHFFRFHVGCYGLWETERRRRG